MSGESLPLRRENCRKLHRQHTVWRWTFSTVLAALFMIFVCFVWFSWARIGNDSMAPTLKKGDLVLVDRIYKYCYEIERTDMVAYRRPGTGELLIKRVVATGGETVSGQNGVNTADFDAVTVPKGYVFVLSDDRQYLEDSREEDIGCVALDDIVGVMHVRISPSFRIYQ